jgi:peroxiredoxin
VIVVVSVNTLSTKPIGLKAGDPVPKFAAPSATGSTDKDANVNPKKACGVSGSDAIRICDYFKRPFVMVAWFTKGCDTCRRQLDTLEALKRRFPEVEFIGLDIKDSLDNARTEVRKHGWTFPMALDRDGAVSGTYGVVVGPTTFLVYPRGILMSKVLGEVDQAELSRKVEALVKASRERQHSQQPR